MHLSYLSSFSIGWRALDSESTMHSPKKYERSLKEDVFDCSAALIVCIRMTRASQMSDVWSWIEMMHLRAWRDAILVTKVHSLLHLIFRALAHLKCGLSHEISVVYKFGLLFPLLCLGRVPCEASLSYGRTCVLLVSLFITYGLHNCYFFCLCRNLCWIICRFILKKKRWLGL